MMKERSSLIAVIVAIPVFILMFSLLMGDCSATGYSKKFPLENDDEDGLTPELGSMHRPRKTVWVDDDNTMGPWNGSPKHPFQFIQDAINEVVDGDTVIVNDGTYKGARNRNLNFKGKAITIRSENGPETTIIDCGGSFADEHRGFSFSNNEEFDSVVDGFTIRNGNAILGGGIYCYDSSPTVINCIITGNSAERDGGGIYCSLSSMTIMNCMINGNSAREGGGVFSYFSNPIITNCTINGNSALDCGGIYCWDSSATITNCTIIGNSALDCGGIYCYDNSNPEIINCILWDNNPHEIRVLRGAPIVTYSNIRGGTGKPWFGEGCIDIDPLFVNPMANNYDLIANSPCIDSGTSDLPAPTMDFHGIDRFDDPNTPNTGGGTMPYYDMGALEYADTDEDGLPDWWELKFFGSLTVADPAVDEEPDGLTNLEEYTHKSNPFNSDTDNDGRTDGEEIADGSNPRYPDNAEKTYYVNNLTGSDMYNGLAASFDGTHGPKQTIQAGIDAAITGWNYTVLVSDGTYTEDGNRDLDFNGKALTLQSENGPDATIIDCEGSDVEEHIGFYFLVNEGHDSVVDGFTIRNGYSDDGGAIYCSDSSPTIINCVITNNTMSEEGGGIHCHRSSPMITNCIISGNSARRGGGIYCLGDSNPTITSCTIIGNSVVKYGGGGIYCWGSNPTIKNCTISGNLAQDGGGIYCNESSPIITNCRITGNAGYIGGGICCIFDSNPTIINCTITGNRAIRGGGIDCNHNTSPTIMNCIVWDNRPREIDVWKGTPIVTYCDIQWSASRSWFGEGCIDADPGFAVDGYWDGDTWVEGDYHLTAGSPCIDAGTNDTPELPLFDLDGLLRIWTGWLYHRVDMGVYEYGSETVGISNIQILGTGDIELTWFCSDEGVTEFDVWYSDDEFSNSMTWYLLEGDVPSGGDETKYVDTTASSAGMRYYKVSY